MFVQLLRRNRQENSLPSHKAWLNGKVRVRNRTGPRKKMEDYKEEGKVTKNSTKRQGTA
jgi:hypothetical protein